MPSADKRARKKENARAAREQREAALKRSKRRRSTITFAVFGALFIGVIVVISLVGGGKKKADSTTTTTTPPTTAASGKVSAPDFKLDAGAAYSASIATNFGNIGVALDTKDAPVAAGHFIKLAKAGVYNGSRWHRIIKDFVIQGGAPGGDPTKNYGKSVVGEVPKSGHYAVGDLAAAKTETDPNGTFDSQFFIVTGSQGVALPAQYADFGSVTSGMDVVRKIEALPTDANTQEPKSKATIDKITITETPASSTGGATSTTSAK